MTEKSNIGKAGESFCAQFYIKNGYEVTAQNFHSIYGEIDVIAQNDDVIVFCEVKTRKENAFSQAREAVDKNKMRKIMLTALKYLSLYPSEKNVRFDVFEVITDGKKLKCYRNNENAFNFDESILGNY